MKKVPSRWFINKSLCCSIKEEFISLADIFRDCLLWISSFWISVLEHASESSFNIVLLVIHILIIINRSITFSGIRISQYRWMMHSLRCLLYLKFITNRWCCVKIHFRLLILISIRNTILITWIISLCCESFKVLHQ